jgi:hypothetical protein
MATTVAKLEAVLEADTSHFDRKMDESGNRIGKFAKAAALGLGAAGVAGAVATLKIGWDEWTQSTKVTAQTNAVLKSTGEVANVTAKHVDDLASSILRKTGIDDETTKSGENLLLTFTNIRNEAGKGNDIFDQTTKIMGDMSVALGQDTKSSAIQLGKALNDPIKGMTALRRVGVSFTKSQIDQVKALIASGHQMKAQKLILGELNKEFGGSAEAAGKTLPGQINILKETFRNFAGDLVGRMIPALMETTSWIRDHWPEIAATVRQIWAQDIKPILSAMIDLIVAVVTTIRDHWNTIGPIVRSVATVIGDAMKVIAGVLRLIIDLIHGDWARAWADVKGIVGNAIDAIKTLISGQLHLLLALGEAIGSSVKDGAVAGLRGIGDAAWGVINNIGEGITNRLDAIREWGAHVANAIKAAVANTLVGIGDGAWGVVNNIGDAITGRLDAIRGWGADIGNAIKNTVVNTLAGIGSGAWSIINNIWEFLQTKKEAVQGWGDRVGTWIKNAIVDALTGLGGALWDKIKGIGGVVGSALQKLNPFGDAANANLGLADLGVAPNSTINQNLWDELALAQRDGLVLTSGYRPGAITKHGTPSDHGVFPSKAIDVAGAPAAMAMFFRQMIGRPGIKQAFYDPLGSIFDGVLNSYREGGHSDHVHVATYDQGGFLQPGWNLAFNGLGRPEPVGAGSGVTVHLTVNGWVGSGQQLAEKMVNEMTLWDRRNGGRLGFA